jgi:ABC-2 type transport system permease protein
MARYWRIYRTFFVSSFARELEFRANFFAKILQNALWIFFFLAILFVVYRNTDSIAGWSRGDALILAATVFLMNAVANAFFFSLAEIPNQVRMGTLDFVVTKPIDSQFWVSTRKFNFDQIGTLVAGVVMIAAGVVTAKLHPDPLQWIGYLTLVGSSLALFYAFNLALMTTGIWLVRVDNLWVLSESITQIARYPLDIYGSGLQRLLTFAIPLGLLSTVPARQLVRGFNLGMVGLGLVWAVAALLLSRAFWRYAMRHYSSASS